MEPWFIYLFCTMVFLLLLSINHNLSKIFSQLHAVKVLMFYRDRSTPPLVEKKEPGAIVGEPYEDVSPKILVTASGTLPKGDITSPIYRIESGKHRTQENRMVIKCVEGDKFANMLIGDDLIVNIPNVKLDLRFEISNRSWQITHLPFRND